MNVVRLMVALVSLVSVSVVVVPATAGAHRDFTPPRLDWSVRQDFAFTTLQRGAYGAWASPVLLTARSQREWTTAMATMASRGELISSQLPSAPVVNWSRQMVVLVALGRLDGYSVEVRRVSRIGRSIVLDTHVEEAPRSGAVDSSPFHLILLSSKPPGDFRAQYDWSLPGLPGGPAASAYGEAAAAPGLAASSSQRAAASDASVSAAPTDDAPAARGMSWGRLKRLYR